MINVNATFFNPDFADKLSEDEKYVIVRKIKQALGIEEACVKLSWEDEERTY